MRYYTLKRHESEEFVVTLDFSFLMIARRSFMLFFSQVSHVFLLCIL